jgi:hypothetical protein
MEQNIEGSWHTLISFHRSDWVMFMSCPYRYLFDVVMLCSSCDNQSSCLPAQLAANDATLSEMLQRLRTCGPKARRERPSLRQRLKSVLQVIVTFLGFGDH